MKIRLLLIILFLFSCSEIKKDYITIKYSSWESAQSIKWHKEYFKKFNEKYPNIRVVLDNVTGQHSAKLLTQIAGGTPPDVTLISESFGEFIKKKVFLSLSEYIEKDKKNLNDYPKQLLKPFIYNDKLYALPLDWNPLVLFYNKDIFDKFRIKYPDESWDWEKMIEIAKKLTLKEKTSYGLMLGNWTEVWFILTKLNGGKIYDSKTKKWLINTPESISALKLLQELIHKYKIAPFMEMMKEMPLFQLGKVAMSIEGAYRVGWYRKIKNFKWGVAPLPRMNGNRFTLIFVAGLALIRDSKHPDAAWEWIKFRSSEEILELHCRRTFLLPASKKLLAKKEFISITDVNYDAIIDSVNYGETYPFVPEFREVYEILKEELSQPLMGLGSPEEACKRAQIRIEKLF